MNQPTLDENGHLATVVVDAKKLTELTDELVALREQVSALTVVNPLWEKVVEELSKLYDDWAKQKPYSIGGLMNAYDDWLG